MQNSLDLDLSMMSEKQERFFLAHKRFIAYGGARGGGKSWAVRHKAIMLALRSNGITRLLLRRTYKDLERNHGREFVPMLKNIAKYHAQDKYFEFPNGSILEMGYCAAESDAQQYQGVEYDVIFFDEATQFTERQFAMIYPSARGANDFPHRIYLTCNPGGVGHEWVKRLFISKHYINGENSDEYEFIFANVFDNKSLMEKDPDYVNMLNSLPDGLREAWRDGNWDMLAGRYFNEFDRSIHIIEPFNIPRHWKRYRGIDYGLDCLACVWVAIDELGNYYIYREYAKSDMIISGGAEEINSLSSDENVEYTVAPSDIWARSQESAKCKADLFQEAGLPLIKGNNNRESGWLALKELMKIYDTDRGKESKLKIFSSCEKLIECLPALQRDQKHPTDCMTEPHEITHLPDALRYFALQYVSPSSEYKKTKTELQKYRDRVLNGKKKRRCYY